MNFFEQQTKTSAGMTCFTEAPANSASIEHDLFFFKRQKFNLFALLLKVKQLKSSTGQRIVCLEGNHYRTVHVMIHWCIETDVS